MDAMKNLIFGAVYYEEYLPYDRLTEDIEMMKRAGMNTVRIAESTWSTCEPQDGMFDFSHVERVLDKMETAGMRVIVGTPTYAVPAWMVKSYPDILAVTENGRGIYGPRQIMDITHPVYRYYCERIIRELMKHTARRKCVTGYQLDNETKYYQTAGKNVQAQFVKYLRWKFGDDIEEMNRRFGLSYWSNSIHSWEDFPDVRGTINGSLGAEFDKFRRGLVTEFLGWQVSIVNEYRREDQFVTHNFDFEWRGHSFGLQPDVDQYQAAKYMTVAGADIYHPAQDDLTGAEIAFGGDLARSLKRDNYLVLETQAQGFPGWTPYKGQLRLQAYSHIASGANGLMYWHWHSLHNACETYWKGVLSHDFQENETYREACRIGEELKRCGSRLVNLRKKNDTAILLSNEALTGLRWFGIDASAADNGKTGYNDVVRWIYDTLYRMNVECDVIWPETQDVEQYRLIIAPALYAVSDDVLIRLKRYVENGGNLIATFKTGFADENVKVSHEVQPRILRECLGVRYHQFTFPKNVKLRGKAIDEKDINDCGAKVFMELLIPEGAQILASYEHDNWKDYAAVTKNRYGGGNACYIGCMTSREVLKEIISDVLKTADIPWHAEAEFPLIVREGINDGGKKVRFYLNYSGQTQSAEYIHPAGQEVLSGRKVGDGEKIVVPGWGVRVIEEN